MTTTISGLPPREVQVSYVSEIVKLMLRHMYRLMSQQDMAFSTAIADYADIYRKTSYFNLNDPVESQKLRPQWNECAAELEALFGRCLADRKPAEELETQGLELLRPSLTQRIDQGLPIVDYRQETSHGCFFYAVTDTAIDLHFVNRIMPESPFKNPVDRVRELHDLLQHCAERYPHLEQLQFGSWLNDYPSYRHLFPSSWRDTGERKSYNSFAWWGQFMNRWGDIHVHNARHFRETGEFPYQCTFHDCPTQDLKEHLLTYLKDGE